MTTYTKTTDFAAKDALTTGNPAKLVKGTEIGAEFDNIAAADATNVKTSSLGTSVATFLATPSSANLAAALTDETGSGAAVFATSPTLVTPTVTTSIVSSGTTVAVFNSTATTVNAFGGTSVALNVGNASGTNTVLGATSFSQTLSAAGAFELGHATDTTLSRSSAGVLAVEGVVIPSISSTSTLTNKRITNRRYAYSAPGATPTINSDTYDIVDMTGIAAAITSLTTNLSGTPSAGDFLQLNFTDDGTARALTFGSSFAATTITLPTTTVISTKLSCLFQWNSTTSKWILVGKA